jgi:pimeloyl-ACP methyl ester carboxylesterase
LTTKEAVMPTATRTAILQDGSAIDLVIQGAGATTLLLPVNPDPVEGPKAEALRRFGADPSLGQTLAEGLSAGARVVAFDYEAHLFATPRPDTLTPDAVVADVRSIADAAGAERFAWYGYSWLGMAGLRLGAALGERLSGLAVGGYPPLEGPYAELLVVTRAGYELATGARSTGSPDDPWATTSLSADQHRQFLTLYEALQGIDERAALAAITCPRLVLVGSEDEVDYGPTWGDVHVSIGGAVARHREELERAGWSVRVLDGLDHMSAMQADRVLPILRPWLATLA